MVLRSSTLTHIIYYILSKDRFVQMLNGGSVGRGQSGGRAVSQKALAESEG